MTCIVNFKSKKAFKIAVYNQPHDTIEIIDPSIVAPFKGTLDQYIAARSGPFTVTNHPKRSWFANVTHNDGRITIR